MTHRLRPIRIHLWSWAHHLQHTCYSSKKREAAGPATRTAGPEDGSLRPSEHHMPTAGYPTTEVSLPGLKRFSPDRSPCCKSTWAPFSLSSGPSLCTQQTRNGGRPKPLPFPSRIFSGPAAERVAAAFPPQRRPPRQLSINQDPGDKSLLTHPPSAVVLTHVFWPREPPRC